MYHRFPLLIWSLVAYLALVSVALLYEPVLWLWPYLFLLAIQEISPAADTHQEIIAALFLGVAPVLLVAWFRQRRLSKVDFEWFEYASSGCLTTLAALAGLTGAAYLIAFLFGWRVGV